MKTLKDIYFPCKDLECLVITKNLQGVAREWIEELEKSLHVAHISIGDELIHNQIIGNQIDWIKMFFNIEEDAE